MGHVKNKNAAKPWRKARWVMVYKGPDGKEIEERGASTEAASQKLLELRERDVASSCWMPLRAATGGGGGGQTFREYEQRHNARRIAKGKALAVDGTEHGRMVKHVYPHIGDKRMDRIERDDIVAIIASLMEQMEECEDEALSPKSILNLYGELRVLFSWALHKDKIIAENPCTLSTKWDELPAKRDKDPRWRNQAKYSSQELIVLLTDPRIPPDRHMVYALEFLGYMRAGECAGRRWMDWDENESPLTKMHIVTQYDDKPVKTRRPRACPVHLVLADMLSEFREFWWPVLYGRRPTPEDFLVPIRGRGRPRSDGQRRCRNAHTMYTQLQRDLELVGFRRRRAHDLRRTGISMTRGGKCDKHALKACTHGERGDVLDDYTTWDWEDLCKAINCLDFALPATTTTSRMASVDVVQSRQRGSRGGASRSRYGDVGSAVGGRAPVVEAPLGPALSIRNNSAILATPTGIEPVLPT